MVAVIWGWSRGGGIFHHYTTSFLKNKPHKYAVIILSYVFSDSGANALLGRFIYSSCGGNLIFYAGLTHKERLLLLTLLQW